MGQQYLRRSRRVNVNEDYTLCRGNGVDVSEDVTDGGEQEEGIVTIEIL